MRAENFCGAAVKIRSVALLLFVTACSGGGGGGSSSSPDSASTSNRVTTTSAGATPHYPIDVPLTPEIEAAGVAAGVQSAALDAICLTMAIDVPLASARPNGTGCPRPAANDEGAR